MIPALQGVGDEGAALADDAALESRHRQRAVNPRSGKPVSPSSCTELSHRRRSDAGPIHFFTGCGIDDAAEARRCPRR